MTFVPIVPVVVTRKKQGGKPSWLKLEKDEAFVRSYGAAPAERAARPLAAVAAALVLTAGLGVFAFAFMTKPATQAAVSQPGDPGPWIAVAVAVILVVNVGIVVAMKAAAKGQKADAYLTSKMLIVRSGKDYAGVRLADITAIQLGSGTEQNTLVVYTRTAQQPVTRLPVTDPAAALAELTAYSKAAGAKLP